LINEGKINKEDIRFFLGYTGWGANQLEEEIESNSWAIATNKYKKGLLSTSSKKIWKEKITELGGDYLIWSNAPENPNLN
jgi:putative transcriptional regulator